MTRRSLLAGSGSLLLAGCTVPRGAPTRAEVVRGAGRDDAGFMLELVSRDRLPLYDSWGRAAHQTGWPRGGAAPTDQVIAPGDTLLLRVWDADDNSLLASPGALFADISNVLVTSGGHVNIPYIDRLTVSGLTAEAARTRIQEELAAISPSAQVQLQVEFGRRNSAEMVGGVGTPGTFPLTERNLPLTSLIAAAGGVEAALTNPQVQITRGNNVFRRSLRFVQENPANDPIVQGGDRILILSDDRSFKALGAAGREEIIGFDAADVSALRAVSLMGGLADARADPRGLLVLRNYPPSAIGGAGRPTHERVVFSFDLRRAEGLFNADRFLLQDGDIVMATQAAGTSTDRVLGLFGSVLGAGTSISDL
ncbi:MAG: polysaccharide biosynthesis/export family protein [Roseinatronobacter sp.]